MSDIISMSPEELVVALFDRAIQDLSDAGTAKEQNEETLFQAKLDHFDRIIVQLCSTLDRSQPVATDLYRLYEFLHYDAGRLRDGSAGYEKEIPAMKGIVTNLRDGFQGAEESLEKQKQEKEQSSI